MPLKDIACKSLITIDKITGFGKREKIRISIPFDEEWRINPVGFYDLLRFKGRIWRTRDDAKGVRIASVAFFHCHSFRRGKCAAKLRHTLEAPTARRMAPVPVNI